MRTGNGLIVNSEKGQYVILEQQDSRRIHRGVEQPHIVETHSTYFVTYPSIRAASLEPEELNACVRVEEVRKGDLIMWTPIGARDETPVLGPIPVTEFVPLDEIMKEKNIVLDLPPNGAILNGWYEPALTIYEQ